MKSLEEVLAYQNNYIVEEFLRKHKNYKLSTEEANLLFDDLKRYLWMTATIDIKREENKDILLLDISISESMIIIDEMWHEFILVTEYYTGFCNENFGKYIHHPPPMPKYELNQKTLSDQECAEIFIGELLETTYDYLGDEVTIRWFDTYRQYLPDNHEEKLSHHM
ncbi:MAG: hypothetical protein ACI85O_000378 [Saprospiraceae bacterium]|jgi:hypothetical protein